MCEDSNGAVPGGAVPSRVQSQEVTNDDVAAGQRAAFKLYHVRTVPKHTKLNSLQKGPLLPPTTMMLRNIPNQYTQSALREEIDNSGFANSYNFFYLPMDVKTHKNLGYAFMNFLNSSDATRFFEAFSSYRFIRVSSRKMGKVSPAYIQGLEKNLQHFQDKAISSGHYRPIVIMAGKVVDVHQALANLSEASKSKVGFTSPQSVKQHVVSTMHHHEANVPTAFPDTVTCSSGEHGPVGPGLSNHGGNAGKKLCLAGFICPDEPRYILPSATMVRPPPGLESPESWRPKALSPQERPVSLRDALESMQKLPPYTGTADASTDFDPDSPTPKAHVSLLADYYSPVGSLGDDLSQ